MELKQVDTLTAKMLLSSMEYKYSDNMMLIEQFMHSDMDIAEVIVDKGRFKKNSTCTSSLNSTIKAMHVGAKAVTRKGTVYLIKTTGKKS